MALESSIQKKVVTYLKSVGCKVVKLVTANTSGNADLIICYRGYYVEFEMKQPGKHATKLQLLKGKETVDAGGAWFEIHSVEEAKEAIEFINKTKGLRDDGVFDC